MHAVNNGNNHADEPIRLALKQQKTETSGVQSINGIMYHTLIFFTRKDFHIISISAHLKVLL
jgi:hypothetical protein